MSRVTSGLKLPQALSMYKFIPFFFFLGTTAHIHAMTDDVLIDPSTQVQNTLPAPQNLSINSFGQWIIGWGTGAEGARQRLENIKREDIIIIKQKGTTLEMIQLWQQYFEQQTVANPNNPTARNRAKLLKKIADLW